MDRPCDLRATLVAVVVALALAVAAPSAGLAGVDADLESGLAYLVAGNNQLAAWHLTRFGERQRDPELRRQVNVTIARLDGLTTASSREAAARELNAIALHWRFRNFPVFP